LNQPDRLREKDALDAFRVFQAFDTATLVAGFNRHQSDEHARTVSQNALEVYRVNASSTEGLIAQLAARAAQGDPGVALSFSILVRELLAAL